MLKQFASLAAGLVATVAVWAAPTVEMTTSAGKITLELNAEKAPKTVEMFLKNARSGFYDDTIFHRVIAGLHDPGRRLQQGDGGKEGTHPGAAE